jgi:hypothetical protein
MEAKSVIRKIIRECVEKLLLKESYDSEFEMALLNMPYELFSMIISRKPITFDLIPKEQYHHALREFMKYGQFIRFPEKYVLQWKGLLLENIAKLYTLTEIHGHSTNFPYDEFYDTFDYKEPLESNQYDLFTNDLEDKYSKGEFSQWLSEKNKENGGEKLKHDDWGTIYEFLDTVYNLDDTTPQFSNGHHVLSDYATEPLMKLGYELDKQTDPNKIIITINKIFDVAHQRSDIAEIFIEGGTKALEYISNS